MKFTNKVVYSFLFLIILVGNSLSSFAAQAAVPIAKYADKVKVVDSKNKTLGFMRPDSTIIFKADNRFFRVRVEGAAQIRGVNRDGEIGQRLIYELSGCTGLVYFDIDWSAYASSGIYETAYLNYDGNGYTVYMYDLSRPLQPELNSDGTGVFIHTNSFRDIDGICTEGDSGNGYFLHKAKVVAKLPFTPPFTLK